MTIRYCTLTTLPKLSFPPAGPSLSQNPQGQHPRLLQLGLSPLPAQPREPQGLLSTNTATKHQLSPSAPPGTNSRNISISQKTPLLSFYLERCQWCGAVWAVSALQDVSGSINTRENPPSCCGAPGNCSYLGSPAKNQELNKPPEIPEHCTH